MCRPTRQRYRGRLLRLGEMSEDDAQPLHRGSGGSTYTRKARATREAPERGQGWSNRTPARDRLGALGSPDGTIVRDVGRGFVSATLPHRADLEGPLRADSTRSPSR